MHAVLRADARQERSQVCRGSLVIEAQDAIEPEGEELNGATEPVATASVDVISCFMAITRALGKVPS